MREKEISAASLTGIRRRLSDMPRLWLMLPRMTDEFFKSEMPRASASATFWSVTCLSIYCTVVAPLSIFAPSRLPGAVGQRGYGEGASSAGVMIVLACVIPVTLILGFYINNGVTHTMAGVLGGKGSFTDQAYLVSLSMVPLTTLAWLANFIRLVPLVGSYLPLVIQVCLSVFGLLLGIRAVKAAHRFSSGRAVVAVLGPILLLLIPVGIIAALMVMGPIIGNTFSTINSSLGTAPAQ